MQQSKLGYPYDYGDELTPEMAQSNSKIYSKIKLQHNLDMKDFIEFLIIGQIDQIIEAVTNVKSSFYTWFFLWIFIRIYRKLNKF